MEAKIQIENITFFHDKITSNQIENMLRILENNNIINKKQIAKSVSISYHNHVTCKVICLLFKKKHNFVQLQLQYLETTITFRNLCCNYILREHALQNVKTFTPRDII